MFNSLGLSMDNSQMNYNKDEFKIIMDGNPANEFFFDFITPDTAPSRDAAKQVFLGMEQIQLTPPSATPHIRQVSNEPGTITHIYYYNDRDITTNGESFRMNHHAIQLMDRASINDTFIFYFDSRGGHMSICASIVSAMSRTQAKVVTIATGMCMSAAALMWSFGHDKYVYPSASIMYHFSSHGSYGNSMQIKKASQVQVKDIIESYLDPILEKGYLTQEEYDLVCAGEDVFIDAITMNDRLGGGKIIDIRKDA